jgi:hypothetical protein
MKKALRRISMITALIFLSFTSFASADPLAIPPTGVAQIYGSQSDFFKCWEKKLGTKVSLQVKESGTWKTVATTQLRVNRGLCPATSTARYKWTVDILGIPYKTTCGIKIYLLEFRELFLSDKSIGSIWSQQEYASKSDYVSLIGEVLDKRVDC